MRFLHTGDWHLGKTLRGRSRLDEQQAALEQIAAAAVSERVDAVLIAGDVYESQAPPPEAERIVYDFFARLAAERIACVVIAGNHDHPRKLEALSGLLAGLGIHIRAGVAPAAKGGVVELPSRDGSERARVAVVPFVPERKIVDAAAIMAGQAQGHQKYADVLGGVVAQLSRSFAGDTVNVLLMHALVSGARFGTGERQLHLGEVYALPPERLPGNAHYAALGHLHRPQEIPGAPCRAAYSGSLIELDFGEREQDKRAVLVDAAPGRPAQLKDIPLTAGRRLRDVAGTLAELRAMADSLGDAFLRVCVKVPEPTPGAADQVRELLPNAVEVQQEWPRQEQDEAAAAAQARSRDPAELFLAYYRREHATEAPAALRELFAAVHKQAAGEGEAP